MRIRSLAKLAIPFLFLIAPACSGGEEPTVDDQGTPAGVSAEEAECICGTTRGDLIGCAHPLCDAGKNNPDNEDCVCGSITAEEDE